MGNHERPIPSVDIILLCYDEGALKVALFRRESEPELGKWGLPGGYIHTDKDVTLDDTAKRVLKTKTELQVSYLEQIGTRGGGYSVRKDPRGWTMSVAYFSVIAADALASSRGGKWFSLAELEALKDNLAFDHASLISEVVKRIAAKVEYSSLGALFLPEEFSISQFQEVFEAITGQTKDSANFRRKVLAADFLELTGNKMEGVSHRAPDLYRLKDHSKLALLSKTF